MVKRIQPVQATLVPDDHNQLTSDHGWDTRKHQDFLKDVVAELQEAGCRVSLFLDPELDMLDAAKTTGTDRIEFYTGPYAWEFDGGKEAAVQKYRAAGIHANQLELGINAGHDLNLHNLRYFVKEVPQVLEVSIGHAIVCDAIYYGLENTIQMYLRELKAAQLETA